MAKDGEKQELPQLGLHILECDITRKVFPLRVVCYMCSEDMSVKNTCQIITFT